MTKYYRIKTKIGVYIFTEGEMGIGLGRENYGEGIGEKVTILKEKDYLIS